MVKQQRITMEQYVKITDGCRENKHRVEREELTQLEATQLVTDELGFGVPITTIQRCAKIAKIQWAKSPATPLPVPLDHEAIVILMGAIAGLYIETGRTIPDDLANLQSTYARETE